MPADWTNASSFTVVDNPEVYIENMAYFETLQAALDNAYNQQMGIFQTVKLTRDVTVSNLNFHKLQYFTLDLNGYTLQSEYKQVSTGTWTVLNLDNCLVNIKNATVNDGATLTLSSVSFQLQGSEDDALLFFWSEASTVQFGVNSYALVGDSEGGSIEIFLNSELGASVKSAKVVHYGDNAFYIGDLNEKVFFGTLQEALDAVKDGETITAIRDAKVSTQTIMGGWETFTLDMNGFELIAAVDIDVTVLWRMAGSPAPDGESSFPDLTRVWYKAAVAWAAESGIVLGYDSGLFGPDDFISREQLATMLWRYAQWTGQNVTEAADLSGYEDAPDISDYALEAMAWANAQGIITGRSETRLAPGHRHKRRAGSDSPQIFRAVSPKTNKTPAANDNGRRRF